MAIGQPFMLNGISMMVNNWFGDDERALATSIATLSMPMGCILGLALGPLFIPDSDRYNPEEGKDNVTHFTFFCACLVTAMTGILIFFFREKPESYPSKASMISELAKKETKFSFKKDFKALLGNRNFICMCISFNCLYSIYTCLGAIISNLLDPFGYSSTDAAIIGITFIFCGLIGSFICSYLMDKTKKYLLIFRIITFGSLFMTIFIYWSLPSEKMWLLDVNVGIMGILIIPIIPIGYSFSIELTYPVSEAMSNGFIVFIAQIVGTILTIVATKLSATNPD